MAPFYSFDWERAHRLCYERNIQLVRANQLGLLLRPNDNVSDDPWNMVILRQPLPDGYSLMRPFMPGNRTSYLSTRNRRDLSNKQRLIPQLATGNTDEDEAELDEVIGAFMDSLDKITHEEASKDPQWFPEYREPEDIWGQMHSLPADLRQDAKHILLQMGLLGLLYSSLPLSDAVWNQLATTETSPLVELLVELDVDVDTSDSGGFDRATASAWAQRRGTDPFANRSGVAPLTMDDVSALAYAEPVRQGVAGLIIVLLTAKCGDTEIMAELSDMFTESPFRAPPLLRADPEERDLREEMWVFLRKMVTAAYEAAVQHGDETDEETVDAQTAQRGLRAYNVLRPGKKATAGLWLLRLLLLNWAMKPDGEQRQPAPEAEPVVEATQPGPHVEPVGEAAQEVIPQAEPVMAAAEVQEELYGDEEWFADGEADDDDAPTVAMPADPPLFAPLATRNPDDSSDTDADNSRLRLRYRHSAPEPESEPESEPEVNENSPPVQNNNNNNNNLNPLQRDSDADDDDTVAQRYGRGPFLYVGTNRAGRDPSDFFPRRPANWSRTEGIVFGRVHTFTAHFNTNSRLVNLNGPSWADSDTEAARTGQISLQPRQARPTLVHICLGLGHSFGLNPPRRLALPAGFEEHPLFAIRTSIQHQTINLNGPEPLPVPEVSTLLALAGRSHDEDMTLDDLRRVVTRYGQLHGYPTLHLGVLRDNCAPVVPSQLRSGTSDFYIWIYYDSSTRLVATQTDTRRRYHRVRHRYMALARGGPGTGNGRASHYMLAVRQGFYRVWEV